MLLWVSDADSVNIISGNSCCLWIGTASVAFHKFRQNTELKLAANSLLCLLFRFVCCQRECLWNSVPLIPTESLSFSIARSTQWDLVLKASAIYCTRHTSELPSVGTSSTFHCSSNHLSITNTIFLLLSLRETRRKAPTPLSSSNQAPV